MSDSEIVDLLAKCDPVKPWGKRRACALCGRLGAENQENISHRPDCPWILAMKSRDPFGPGAKWDRRKCLKCGAITESGLGSSRICKDCDARPSEMEREP